MRPGRWVVFGRGGRRPSNGGAGYARQASSGCARLAGVVSGSSHLQPSDRAGRPVNVAELVRRSAALTPGKAALVAGDRQLTWSELDAAVDQAAAALSGLGLVAGFRVALALGNSLEFAVAYFGALRAGLVAVPINPANSADEVAGLLSAVRARVVLADEQSVGVVRSVVHERDPELDPEAAPLVVPVGVDALPEECAYAELLERPAPAPAVPPADPETLAVVLSTSGTSGPPRAAMLTHRSLLANLDQIAAIEPPAMQDSDVVLGVLPFCHVYGLNAVLGMVAHSGATLVIIDRFDPVRTLDLVATEKVTVVPAVPQVFGSWVRQGDLAARLATVRLLISGAEPLPAAVRVGIQEATRLVVQEGYGLTEAAPTVTSTMCSAGSAESSVHKLGAVGAPLPGVELRIVDDAGNDVEPGEPGEILVRGQNVFSGYWPDGSEAPGDKGWLATRDVGYLDPDGDLVLVDRLTELVLVSGFHVYPREVEDAIRELDAVADVAVVATPDEQTGEAVKAYVVPRPGETVTPEIVLDHCEARLARFKRPTTVRVVSALPRSVTGTVAKARLRLAETSSASDT